MITTKKHFHLTLISHVSNAYTGRLEDSEGRWLLEIEGRALFVKGINYFIIANSKKCT